MRSAPSQATTAATGVECPARLADVRLPPEEVRALLTIQPNLMLSGPEAITSAVIRSLRPVLRQPVWETDAEALTPPTTPVGAVIVWCAASLAAEDQTRLLRWIRDHLRVQLVTITEKPMFPLVSRGAFLAPLYYLLNTMYVET
jgi:hypothetical protein